MHDVRLSPDYEAMEADFAASESFLDGYIFVGKKYLFSVYDGSIVLREDLSNVYLKFPYMHGEVHQWI